jgi:pimeloyl-ACP methyl ester carboxylesterase
MKNKIGFQKSLLSAMIMLGLLTGVAGQPVKGLSNIVIVHGAFADASGWEAVFNILQAKGYKVTLVQNPLTSLEDDVAATERILDKQDGPTVLVGHSWGGAVITQAGVHSKVSSLVYVAAFVPQVGESGLDLIKTAAPAAENGILPPDEKGFVWYDKAKYHTGFAADISKEKAEFMYASQGPIAVKCFVTSLTQAAWKTKTSYAIVATEDKSINPDIERSMYKRAGSVVSELKGSHVIFMSNAKAVANIIETAAKAVEK